MKVSNLHFKNGIEIARETSDGFDSLNCKLVLTFGAKSQFENQNNYDFLKNMFPNAEIVSCSTAGEIYSDAVYDDTIVATCIEFQKSTLVTHKVNISEFESSFEAGKKLASMVDQNGLKYLFIISDGGKVNGSQLINGINTIIPENIPVTGGLAGDSDKFESTLVGLNENPQSGNIVGVAFYGNSLKVGHGSLGGWDMFGPEREVTKSKDNILYEIEGKNALDIYKNYLGNYAEQLPGSALLFPLSMKEEGSNNNVVRTILSIDEETQSMTFAGDIPLKSKVRFMKANFDRLIDAANSAAIQTKSLANEQNPTLAVLISCVGRKLILGKRVSEEVEAVNETFDGKTFLSGFYSYGEISPFNNNAKCELHNQTMTITTLTED